ncbi:MAG TPA: hypothetical protein ENN73_02125, partial [Firmicutes bacterium]|nr:hypothetical protein [Bacillota bacterium]
YNYKMDSKNRIPIPVSFRNYLIENFPDEEFILVAGLGKYLYLHPRSLWSKYSKRLKKKYFDANLRKWDTFFNAFSTPVNMDKQGRILVPDNLIKYAGLKENVIIVGNQNWLELWSEESWNKFTEELIKSAESFDELDKMFRAMNIEESEEEK